MPDFIEVKQTLRLEESTGKWVIWSIRRTPNGSLFSVRVGYWYA